MEFVERSEFVEVLGEYGYAEVPEADDRLHLVMPDQHGVVHIHVTGHDNEIEPRTGAKVIAVATDALPDMVEHVIHRLGTQDLLLIPVCKWRHVFDAVAFSMASNEAWQEIDAAATVELNTRDPLLCGPADLGLVLDLVRALLTDGEGLQQCLAITSTGIPFIIEIVPDGVVRLSLGNPVLADEVLDAMGAKEA